MVKATVKVEGVEYLIEDLLKDFIPEDFDLDPKDFDQRQLDPQYVIRLHSILYEYIYSYFHHINYVPGMTKAMKAREKLLGLRGTSQSSINSLKAGNINQEHEYDQGRLTNSQLERFNSLMDKARIIN